MMRSMENGEGAEKRSFVTRYGIIVAIVVVLAFIGGILVGTGGPSKAFEGIPLLGNALDSTPDQSADLADFWKAWNVLSTEFVQTHGSTTAPTLKEKIWGAMKGLTESYGDPYTVFLPPEDAKIFVDDIAGNFEGVGMEIGEDNDGVLTVIAPIKGTPADKAGIQPGDKVLAIDGTSTKGISTDDAVKKIRGKKGTVVAFTLLRDKQTLTINVTRDVIETPVMDNNLDAKSGVYTISIYSFSANAGQLFNRALMDFRASGSTKLIIDLRGDPGGYLEAAVSIASHFLPQGTAVVTEDYAGKRENVVHKSAGTDGVPEGTKVAVLINKGSASASEILSGALQDAKVATLIGTKSFGKGSVQELVNISGGSLKVTVARWLTPAGRWISNGGLTPDIAVERTQEDLQAGKDPQRERAIQFLTTGK